VDHINIGALKLNGVGGASLVGIGPQTVIGATSVIKSIQGTGQIDGNFSALPVFSSLVNDIDLIDAPAWNITHISPRW
jgi:hypothetical protein